jgi:hypothetical protein
MKQKYKEGDDLNIEFKFFFENLTTSETFQTNDRCMAVAEFSKCQFPCELWEDGDILYEKDYEDDMINDKVSLVETYWGGSNAEYVDIEMAEI